MQLIRRHFLRLACAAAATSAVSRTAGAQTYPTRAVRIIVPFAAGGPATVLAHVLAHR
jgi:tripartite-type tricarboxylate transporter receptor subunit TctC